MTFDEIKSLIQLVNKSDLAEFKYSDGDHKIIIRTSKYSAGKQPIIQSPITMAAAPNMMMPPSTPVAAAPNESAQSSKQDEAPKGAAAEKSTEGGGNYLEIKSPIVGTFYRSSGPDKPVYAKVGDKVQKGSVVCIVEAMKLFNEIESEVEGTIVKVMTEDASPVEYDQVLFLVDPKG